MIELGVQACVCVCIQMVCQAVALAWQLVIFFTHLLFVICDQAISDPFYAVTGRLRDEIAR